MELNEKYEDTPEKTEKKGFFGNMSFGAGSMVLCVGITAAASLLGMEGLFSEGAMVPLRTAALILMLVNWFFSAYLGGRDGRSIFPAFALCYWIVPTTVHIACGFSVSNSAAVSVIGELGEFARLFEERPVVMSGSDTAEFSRDSGKEVYVFRYKGTR